MTATTEPDLAVDTARLYLDQLRGPDIQAYRHLDAARNEAAHISATPRTDDLDVPPPENRICHRRPEDRQPTQAPGPIGRGPTR